MTNNIMDIKEIYNQYETTNMNHPRISESFAEAQAERAEAREKTAYKTASPVAIAQALRTVFKNEGARFVNLSGASLAALVKKALEDEDIRCA